MHKIDRWDKVILTNAWQKKAKQAKIPYEMEWFIVSRLHTDASGNVVAFDLSGSNGGRFPQSIALNTPGVISSKIGNLMD